MVMEMPGLPQSPSIFLDANSIHNVASYLIQADRLHLPPFQPRASLEVVRGELRNHLPHNLADNLINGLRTLSYLQNQVEQNDARIFTSRLAIAELWYGRLDGQAHIRMSLEGIPYRQRQRQSDISALVLARLTQTDYETVSNEFSNLIQVWYSSYGIEVNFVEDNGAPNPRDVSILALEIQKITFLDVIDCVLLSGSLSILANEFITSDNHLFYVINNLKRLANITDPDERVLWLSAQQAIVDALKRLHLSETITAEDICEPRRPNSLGDNISGLHIL